MHCNHDNKGWVEQVVEAVGGMLRLELYAVWAFTLKNQHNVLLAKGSHELQLDLADLNFVTR